MKFTESFIKTPDVISQCYKNVNLILASIFLFLFFYFWKPISFLSGILNFLKSFPPCSFYLSSFNILQMLSADQMRGKGAGKFLTAFQDFAVHSGQSHVIFPPSFSCNAYKPFAGPYKPSK